MNSYGCFNCKHLKCYPGDRWTPPEYECHADGPETEELLVRVYEDGETWSDAEHPLCCDYEKFIEIDDYPY